MLTLRLKFIERQGAEDIYMSVYKPYRYYVRQPNNDKETVAWLSSSKWTGGVEASCNLKAGTVIEIVDTYLPDAPVIYTEVIEKYSSDEYNNFPDETYAKKIAPFSYEATQLIAEEFANKFSLKTHNEWTQWLTAAGKEFGVNGFDDNWIYCSSEVMGETVMERLSYLNRRCSLVMLRKRHSVATESEWTEYLLISDDHIVIEICGYDY